uniref:Uncharacterized protein n=1 Tax=Panagrolaimus davidi TaxID=227884 RepID=A0A914PSG1_9BILA
MAFGEMVFGEKSGIPTNGRRTVGILNGLDGVLLKLAKRIGGGNSEGGVEYIVNICVEGDGTSKGATASGKTSSKDTSPMFDFEKTTGALVNTDGAEVENDGTEATKAGGNSNLITVDVSGISILIVFAIVDLLRCSRTGDSFFELCEDDLLIGEIE